MIFGREFYHLENKPQQTSMKETGIKPKTGDPIGNLRFMTFQYFGNAGVLRSLKSLRIQIIGNIQRPFNLIRGCFFERFGLLQQTRYLRK